VSGHRRLQRPAAGKNGGSLWTIDSAAGLLGGWPTHYVSPVPT
jgi:hypothetical protein